MFTLIPSDPPIKAYAHLVLKLSPVGRSHLATGRKYVSWSHTVSSWGSEPTFSLTVSCYVPCLSMGPYHLIAFGSWSMLTNFLNCTGMVYISNTYFYLHALTNFFSHTSLTNSAYLFPLLVSLALIPALFASPHPVQPGSQLQTFLASSILISSTLHTLSTKNCGLLNCSVLSSEWPKA